MKKLILLISLIFSLVVFSPIAVMAATKTGDDGGNSNSTGGELSAVCEDNSDSLVCKQGNRKLDDLAVKVLQVLMYIVGIGSVVFIIYGGLLYATSSGKPEVLTRAKKTISGAIIGLMVALLALAIVNLVKKSVDSTTSSGQPQAQQGQ